MIFTIFDRISADLEVSEKPQANQICVLINCDRLVNKKKLTT